MERDQSIEKLQCQVTSLQQVIVARHVAQPSRSTWLIRRAPRASVVARHVAVVARHVAQSLHATGLSCCVPRGSVVARHVAQSMLTKALCYTRPLSRRQPCASAYVVAVDLSEQKRALSLIQVFCQ